LPDSSGEKLCPICDSPLQPGSKKCGFCGTDLTIFDIEIEPAKNAPTPPPAPSRARIESRVEEILSRPSGIRDLSPPPARAAKSVAPEPETKLEPELVPEPKPSSEEPAVEQPAVETFECPECGGKVDATAGSCPKCGVLFAEEGADKFQCPACNTLVNVDAQTCPGCGAVFVESEEAVEETVKETASGQATVTAPAEIEAPVTEVEEEPVTRPPRAAKPDAAAEKKGLLGGFFKRKKKEEPEKKPEPEATQEVEEEAESAIPGIHAPDVIHPVRKLAPKAEPRPEPRPAPVVEERAPAQPSPALDAKDKGKELARMVAEIKPLLALAMEKEVDISEPKRLIDDAAVAGRERQLDTALDLVVQSKSILLNKLDVQLTAMLGQLREELKVASSLGADVSRPTTYIQETERAKAAGDAEAAFVYAEKVQRDLLPITGRYNESKRKIAALKALIADCEVFIVDTKEPRGLLVEAGNAFESNDYGEVDSLVHAAEEKLYKTIPNRMADEINKAKELLREAKMRNVNITPMITTLKSVINLMKAGDYRQAMKEMRDFKEAVREGA
jgi:hypothetical protein